MAVLGEILTDVISLLKSQGFSTSIELKILWTGTDNLTAVSCRPGIIRHLNLTTKEPILMTTNILNDVISVVPVEFDNPEGTAVPKPASDTITVTGDDPSVTVALDADGSSFDITPALPAGTSTGVLNVTYTATPSDGSAAFGFTTQFQFTADKTAVSAHPVTTGITTRPLPAAPPAGP
jgi:hypothetical protein